MAKLSDYFKILIACLLFQMAVSSSEALRVKAIVREVAGVGSQRGMVMKLL